MTVIASHSGLRVLVIENDVATQILIAAVFRRHDVLVDAAVDREEALQRLGRDQYDAVILEPMMPGAFEIIRELKSSTVETLSRTIVLTSASDSVLSAFEAGHLIRRILRKPFDVGELVDAVLSCPSAALESRAGSPAQHYAH